MCNNGIDHQMAMIQVQVCKNFIDDVLIEGGFGVNIIIENLGVQLGLSKLNIMFYDLRVANQTIAKPFGFIRDLKIFVHEFLIQLHLPLSTAMF
jgi:hypothetical protein